MKHIKAHSLKGEALTVGAMLAIGAASLLPWRLAAQPSRALPASNPGGAELRTGEQSPPPEPPADRATPPPTRSRPMRPSAAARMPPPSSEMMPSGPSLPVPSAPAEIAPARFEATVYEVQVPDNQIAELEAPALEAKAATAQALAKALERFGKPRILYKIDQPVNLFGETIMLGTSEPVVTSARRMDSGPSINSISYQQVGLIVNLSASPPPKDSPGKGLGVQVRFELSALAESGVELAPQVKATSIRNVQLNHSETPRFGKPVVLLNISAPSGSDKALPVAYVVRYIFREINP